MASLGHIAVGLAAARTLSPRQRPSWTSMAVWSGLAMLPDADVIGLPLGIAYEAPWGHRGATHSLVFALAVAGVAALVAPRLGLLRGRTFAVAAVVLASHPLLDTLTDGGLGCALLWPFDLTRYFAPWRPMPVSPIGLAFFSPYGAFVAATELILFSPLLRFAWFTGVPARQSCVSARGLLGGMARPCVAHRIDRSGAPTCPGIDISREHGIRSRVFRSRV